MKFINDKSLNMICDSKNGWLVRSECVEQNGLCLNFVCFSSAVKLNCCPVHTGEITSRCGSDLLSVHPSTKRDWYSAPGPCSDCSCRRCSGSKVTANYICSMLCETVNLSRIHKWVPLGLLSVDVAVIYQFIIHQEKDAGLQSALGSRMWPCRYCSTCWHHAWCWMYWTRSGQGQLVSAASTQVWKLPLFFLMTVENLKDRFIFSGVSCSCCSYRPGERCFLCQF